jgi:hypothetical protein
VTFKITPYSFEHEGRTYIVVDTPGFDDSRISDKEILAELLTWLNTNYQENQKLNGILYLHRIDAPRMQGTALRNFKMFKQLCGEAFYKNLCLGTTRWSLLKGDIATGERREADLKDKGGFWHPMIAKGSQFVRIPDDQDSAREIIFKLAAKTPAFLKSQDEMGKEGLSPDEVSAAKALEDEELERVKAENERKRKLEKERLEKKQREKEAALRAKHEKEKRKWEERLREQERERERLEQLERDREQERQREMRALEERLRQTRLQEEREREREQVERQKRLDNTQFALEFQKLVYAKKYGRLSARVLTSWYGSVRVCGHCFRFLENETYWGGINFSFDATLLTLLEPHSLTDNRMRRS